MFCIQLAIRQSNLLIRIATFRILVLPLEIIIDWWSSIGIFPFTLWLDQISNLHSNCRRSTQGFILKITLFVAEIHVLNNTVTLLCRMVSVVSFCEWSVWVSSLWSVTVLDNLQLRYRVEQCNLKVETNLRFPCGSLKIKNIEAVILATV